MTVPRQCSRAACARPASATLTYVYADSTVVLGPLATYAEPHAYDLCAQHSQRLTAPRGWEVVRLASDQPPPTSHDDLVALAEAVRRDRARPPQRVVRPSVPTAAPAGPQGPAPVTLPEPSTVTETARRGHLRVLRDDG